MILTDETNTMEICKWEEGRKLPFSAVRTLGEMSMDNSVLSISRAENEDKLSVLLVVPLFSPTLL